MGVRMRKYLIILVLALSVLLVSGCTSQQNNETKTYTQNNISFQYPANWELARSTAPNAIIAVADPNSMVNNTPTTQVVIQKSPLSKGSNLTIAYSDNYKNFFNNTGNVKVSEANITSDKLKAYENVYTANATGIEKQFRAVWLQKNGQIYVILCSAKKSDFQGQQGNFDLIINSFQGT
jgi:predicted Zn-dependent protease